MRLAETIPEAILTAESQAIRSRILGASEAAAVMGECPWTTGADLVARKKYPEAAASSGFKDNAAMKAGRKLEVVIRAMYVEEKGYKVVVPERTIIHPDYPNVGCTLDGAVLTDDNEADYLSWQGLLECKNTSLRAAHKWGTNENDGVPRNYWIQTQVQMAVTGMPWCDVAVLIGGSDFRIYRVPAAPETGRAICERMQDFWNRYIAGNEMVPVGAGEGSTNLLRAMYPQGNNDLLPGPDDVGEMVRAYKDAKKAAESLEERATSLRNQVCARIGAAQGMKGNGWRATWKNTKDTTKTDWESVCHDAGVSKQIIEKWTKKQPGYRRFNIDIEGE